ncbi:DoxX [Proteus penneri]|nr:DoxX [Proteus penneri]
MINKFNQLVDCSDLGKLVLRVSLGVLMLLHGLHKMEPGGLAGIQGMLANFNLPAFIAYGTVIGGSRCTYLTDHWLIYSCFSICFSWYDVCCYFDGSFW